MLRRRLLIMLALLTMLMLGTAISSVLLMRGVLQDLEYINKSAMADSTTLNSLSVSITNIEAEFIEWSLSSDLDTQKVAQLSSVMESAISQLRTRHAISPEDHQWSTDMNDTWMLFDQQLSKLMGTPDTLDAQSAGEFFVLINEIRQASVHLSTSALERLKREQVEVTAMFRLSAIILAAIFVILINASILLLIRAASSILRPVDRLVDASRHLADEEYDYRVEVGRTDEFDELAQGFNNLAEHLEQNEQRKVETLRQVARMLNHELNNAIAIIKLQLRIVEKSSAYNPESSEQLNLIHDTLHKMNQTVTSLAHVRRVVLTDYIKGVQMLDLKLSSLEQSPSDDNAEEAKRTSSV